MRLGLGTDISVGYRQPLFGGVPLLLDKYTGAAAAYSLRQLRTGVTNVVRVRRDTTPSAEQDFTAEEIIDGTLLSFVGAGNNGYVVTWYDQSENGNDATQSTAASQPQIVDAGNLVVDNGKPAVEFEPSVTRTPLNFSNNIIIGTNDFYITSIVKNKTNQPNNWIDSSTNGLDILFLNNIVRLAKSDANTVIDTSTSLNNLDVYLIDFLRYGGNVEAYINGSADGSVADSTDFSAKIDFIGDDEVILQELIIYNSDQSSNRTGIEANINDHYNIYP